MKQIVVLFIALLFTANFTSTSACNVGYFDVVFKGVVNDYTNCTSTWTYEVTGKGLNNGSYKDLSHWVLALCDNHKVLSASYAGKWEVNTDPKLQIYGIKWNVPVAKKGETITFTFVLDGIYSKTSVRVGVKAGDDLLYGWVSGPSCNPQPCQQVEAITPILECVQPIGDNRYVAYFGYINENATAINIPVGNNNYFSPDPKNRNQVTTFNPGRTGYYPNTAFTVEFNGEPITWRLKGPDGVMREVTASKDNLPCENTPEPGSLGNKVWFDVNKDGIQNGSEIGVAGVTVKLFNCDDTELASQVTDAEGIYLFNNLTVGNYYVEFNLPEGYVFTTADQGNEDFDSDANVVTGKTICTSIIEGEDDLSWDAGIYIPETVKEIDLSLIKTVDNNKPKSGDDITFTLTVTNNGPDNATGVQVQDLLRSGFTFKSSNGVYDAVSGIWTVGDLNRGESKSLQITVTVDESEIHTTTFDLGIAKDFNLLIFEDADMPSSDTQGRMAVGRNASLSNYSVGDQLSGADGNVDVLVVGNHLQFTSGAVYHGNIVYGKSTNLPIYPVSIEGGELKQGNPVDFTAAQTYLTNLSTDLAAYTVNGTTTMEWGGLSLTGTDPLLNVFAVRGEDLSNANDFQITVPNGSVALVNIDGTNVKWTGGLLVHGTSISNVLYNFHQAAQLTIQGIDVRGSILAPFAHVDFISGVQNGQMIAKSLSGQGQFNYVMFLGNIPEEKTLSNIAEVFAVNQADIDSEPANGDSSEDDYSSVIVYVNGSDDNSGGNNGGGDESGNWEPVGSSPITEMIWSLVTNSDALYAGTVGGKIFKSSDNGKQWSRVNNDMNVGWIWSIAIHSGYYFAATEHGVYRSQNGTTWQLTGLNSKDVRTLKFKGDVLYAGTWGYGVYESADFGVTWTEMNTDLSCLAVHALAINNSGDIFAGTFGGGVFKYDEAKWVKLDVGYDHVWALGITSTNKLYAGTYGGGVYYSEDNGSSWSSLNGGLPSQFIYAVNILGENVYLNTWEGGIYGLTAQSSEWFSTGMAGKGVTSIAANASSQTLYLGTKNGMIYQSVKSLTAVDEETALPTEFDLDQNYPNPFNPTTMIQFSIPAAGSYNISVYNSLGQMVETLAESNFEAGVHTIQFNAANYASGVYIYRLAGENVSISKKMILAK